MLDKDHELLIKLCELLYTLKGSYAEQYGHFFKADPHCKYTALSKKAFLTKQKSNVLNILDELNKIANELKSE